MRQLQGSKPIVNRKNASLEKYLQEIGSEELLTAEEEIQLAKRIKKGDKNALKKLTIANLKFVIAIAKKYQNRGLCLEDLIAEGNIGLIKAAEKFDDTCGSKFTSYAVRLVRQSIQQAIVEKGNVVKIPVNKIGNINKISYATNQFEQKYERRPSLEEIAEKLNVEKNRIEDVLKVLRPNVSVDSKIESGKVDKILDVTAKDDESQVDGELFQKMLREEISKMLDVLNDRERIVIELYYGIHHVEQTMAEIAIKCNLTRERVRQIKEKAIRKLRKNTNNKLLKSYLGR